MRSTMKTFRTAVIVCAIASAVHYLINNKRYTLPVPEIKKLAGRYSGQHPSGSLTSILSELRVRYSKHIIPTTDPNWFTFGGNLQAKIYLMHVSLTEYLAVIGTPLRTSGHIGFHWMNQSCSVLVGNVQRWKDGASLSKENFRPGDNIRFAMFEGSVLEMAEDTWALCYGRGFLPASVPYMALNMLTHSADPLTPLRMTYTSGRSIFREIYYWFEETWSHYMRKFTGSK